MSGQDPKLLCPSSQPDQDGAVVFGVVGGTADRPRVAYTAAPAPPAADVLAAVRRTPGGEGIGESSPGGERAAGRVAAAEVFRIASPCAAARCAQFDADAGTCSIGRRLVELGTPVVARLPRCAIRPQCRWWHEQGAAACFRCPAVITEDYAASAELAAIAGPVGIERPPGPPRPPAEP